VSAPIPAGEHTFGLRCREWDGQIEFWDPVLSIATFDDN
jgi:hypothetical protein